MSKKKRTQAPAPLPPPATPPQLEQTPHVEWLTRPWVPEGLLCLAALLVFGASVFNDFVFFDDDKAILYNQTLQNPSLGKFFSGQNLGMYAPMTWIAYWVGQGLSGKEAWGYHLLGLLLHGFNSVLVFGILKRLTGLLWPAFAAALLFAVHPIQAEAVCWAAALSTVLFSTFFLLSVTAYIRATTSPTPSYGWLALSLLSFLAACLAKSAAVTLPLVLVAVDFYLNKKLDGKFWLSKIPYLILSVLFGIYTFSTRAAEGHDITAASSLFTVADRFWMVCQTILFYPVKMLLPFLGYSVAYPFVKVGGSWPYLYYLSPFVLLGLGAFLFLKGRNYPNVLLGAALYFLPLTVMLPFRTVGSFELRSDRYVYLSCVGLFFMAGLLLEKARLSFRGGILLAVAVVFGFFGFRQSQIWQNGVSLFQNCVHKTPESSLCQCNLGYNALITSDFKRSIKHYSEALRFEPNTVEAYSGRGQAYLQEQQIQEALDDFDKAIKGGLSSPKLFMNRGKCLVMLDRPAEALPDLTKSLTLEPKSAETYFFRGSAYEKTGDFDQAINDYGQAAQLQPDYVEALGNRGFLYIKKEQWPEAIADYSAAIKANPDIPLLYNNRANAYLRLGQLELALSDVNKAVLLNPNYKIGYRMRSIILRQMGRLEEAQRDYERSN